MARAIPDARLELVAGATHGLPMDEPELVSRLIFAFLTESEGTGQTSR
jgi:pimeloyl-ACP methyl ester carboxylesterase